MKNKITVKDLPKREKILFGEYINTEYTRNTFVVFCEERILNFSRGIE